MERIKCSVEKGNMVLEENAIIVLLISMGNMIMGMKIIDIGYAGNVLGDILVMEEIKEK